SVAIGTMKDGLAPAFGNPRDRWQLVGYTDSEKDASALAGLSVCRQDSEIVGRSCNRFGPTFKPRQGRIGLELLARVQGNLAGVDTVLAEKPVGMAREAIAPRTRVDHQYRPSCSDKLQGR